MPCPVLVVEVIRTPSGVSCKAAGSYMADTEMGAPADSIVEPLRLNLALYFGMSYASLRSLHTANLASGYSLPCLKCWHCSNIRLTTWIGK